MEKKEKKNNNTGLIVIIVILTLLVLGLGGYTIYDKQMEKKDTKEESTKTEEVVTKEETAPRVDLPLDDYNVVHLFNIFRIDKACYGTINDLNTNNKFKLRLAYENVPKYNIITMSCSELDGEANGSYCGYGVGNNTDVVTEEILKNKYIELFGSQSNYIAESFGDGNIIEPTCHFMKYDETKKVYARYSGECGGTCNGGTEEITEAYTVGDNLYIVTSHTSELVGNKKNTYEFTKEDGRYIFSKATQE